MVWPKRTKLSEKHGGLGLALRGPGATREREGGRTEEGERGREIRERAIHSESSAFIVKGRGRLRCSAPPHPPTHPPSPASSIPIHAWKKQNREHRRACMRTKKKQMLHGAAGATIQPEDGAHLPGGNAGRPGPVCRQRGRPHVPHLSHRGGEHKVRRQQVCFLRHRKRWTCIRRWERRCTYVTYL